MQTLKLEGAYTALITPFKEDGFIDWEGLEKNIEFQIAQGITGVLPMGTTGESPAVIWKEHEETIERTIRIVNQRVKVLAGTGSNSTEEALAGSRHAAEQGADALLLVDCYYNGPSSLELRDYYYRPIAEAVPRTTIVSYVIPGRTGCALSADDLALLHADCPNLCCVKEATGDLARMRRERELLPDPFSIMSGDDDKTFAMMTDPAIQANGVISVMSNLVPGGVEQMVRALEAGDEAKGRQLMENLTPLFGLVGISMENERQLPNGKTVQVLDKFRNPLPIKTILRGLGLPSGPCRRPLGLMTPNAVAKAREAVREVWNNAPELLSPLQDHFGIDVEARLNDDKIWEKLAC